MIKILRYSKNKNKISERKIYRKQKENGNKSGNRNDYWSFSINFSL